MEKQAQNQRGEERVSAALPVDLGAATGVTRDFSASGIFFETDAPPKGDAHIIQTEELKRVFHDAL